MLQAFGKQAQADAVPVQRLYIIPALTPEHKHMAAERVGQQHVLHLRRQPIKALSHIRGAARQPHLRARSQLHHAQLFTARNTRRSAGSSTLLSNRSLAPPGSSSSISPAIRGAVTGAGVSTPL